MTNETNKQNQGHFLVSGRVVPIRREGNIVYARTLRRGEEDTGEAVHLEPGDRIVFPAGELVVDSRDIDEHYNPKRAGGYRPVANTVWSWYRIAPERLGFFLFFFALARRTDAAYALWALAIEARDKARKESGVPQRLAHLNALASAEVAVVALGRCYRMVNTLVEKHCPQLRVPDSVAKTQEAALEMRNAFEHIDERAEGKVGRGRFDAEALTIFDQPDFVKSSLLRYKNHRLDFETDVIAALVDCRELVMDAIDVRAKQQAASKKAERS
ncbi:MAG: hypothetical protein OXG44_17655 [Gammaproteobacteria bacterium]|nr:hypothetical protein [Gammaproteobacteria bacterium]